MNSYQNKRLNCWIIFCASQKFFEGVEISLRKQEWTASHEKGQIVLNFRFQRSRNAWRLDQEIELSIASRFSLIFTYTRQVLRMETARIRVDARDHHNLERSRQSLQTSSDSYEPVQGITSNRVRMKHRVVHDCISMFEMNLQGRWIEHSTGQQNHRRCDPREALHPR